MSGQDSPPQAPRRKKLVLRKIGVDGASIPDTWSNSYTGPLPVVRPPPRPSFTSEALVEAAADADPEIISEIAIDATVIVAPSPDAQAFAAMTAAAPSSTDLPSPRAPLASQPLISQPLVSRPVPGPIAAAAVPLDAGSRTTVSPVVATLPPGEGPGEAQTAPPLFRNMRFSLDSKVLAAGGAMAAAMLLVALGVVLGVHSARVTAPDTTAPASATLASAPVNDGKGGGSGGSAIGAGSKPSAPPSSALDIPAVAAAVGPAATAPVAGTAPVVDSASAKTDGAARSDGAGKADVSLTVDVSQLPAARPARNRWTPVAARAPQGTGWTVVAPAPAEQSPAPATSTAGGTSATGPAGKADGDWSPTDAPTAPVASGKAAADAVPVAAPAPTVDPFVQAVREDIREDEASRTK